MNVYVRVYVKYTSTEKYETTVDAEDGLTYISGGKYGFFWDQVNASICKFRSITFLQLLISITWI